MVPVLELSKLCLVLLLLQNKNKSYPIFFTGYHALTTLPTTGTRLSVVIDEAYPIQSDFTLPKILLPHTLYASHNTNAVRAEYFG